MSTFTRTPRERERKKGALDRLIVFMILFTLLLVFISPVSAQLPPPSPPPTLYVDDDFDPSTPGWGVTHFAKIQDAIDFADLHSITICTISVFPGTYNENVLLEDNLFTFFAKMIHLVSRSGSASTFIDGGQNGPTVTVTGAGPGCEIKGFEIRNGSGVDYENNGTYYGGGIFCQNSKIRIRNNNIVDNTSHYGGGICCYYDKDYPNPNNPKACAPTIENNTIRDNNATTDGGGICCLKLMDQVIIQNNEIYENTSGSRGGGVYIQGTFYAQGNYISLVEDNTIFSNTIPSVNGIGAGLATDGNGINKIVNNEIYLNQCMLGSGGGIFVGNKTSPFVLDQDIIDRNYVNGNWAYFGGGIFVGGTNLAILTNNAVSENVATLFGGGIYIAVEDTSIASKQLTNNSVSFNSTLSSNGTGGGIYADILASNTVGIANTIVYGNTSSGINELDYFGAPPSVTYCDVEDRITPGTAWWPGAGNIWANPQYTDMQLHIPSTSPCKDKGSNTATNIPGSHPDIPAWDFDGEPRIFNNKVDIGSDEVQR